MPHDTSPLAPFDPANPTAWVRDLDRRLQLLGEALHVPAPVPTDGLTRLDVQAMIDTTLATREADRIQELINTGQITPPTTALSILTSQVSGSTPAFKNQLWASRLRLDQRLTQRYIVVTYSASMTFDASTGNWFYINITDTNAFTINNPTNPLKGQVIYLSLRNNAGGALGAMTLGAAFNSTFTKPDTNLQTSTAIFGYDGAQWVQFNIAVTLLPPTGTPGADPGGDDGSGPT